MAWAAIRATLGRVSLLSWALAVALVAALAWGVGQNYQARVEHAEKLKAVQDLADLRLAAAQTTAQVLTTTLASQQESLNAAQKATANEIRARGAVTAALGRVLSDVRATDGADADPPAAAGSAPAATGSLVCPDVLGRVGEAAERIAAEAGRYRIAGAKCEADYEAAERALKAPTP